MLSPLGLCHRTSHLEGYDILNELMSRFALTALAYVTGRLVLKAMTSLLNSHRNFALTPWPPLLPLIGHGHLPGEADGLGIALIELHDEVYDAAGDLIDGPNNDELPLFDQLHDVLVC